MKETDLLHQVLEIPRPWHVIDVRYDAGRRKVDIWIEEEAERGGWFLRRATRGAGGREHIWRHVDLGGWVCYIHLRAQRDQPPPSYAWCGDGDTPFTGALARRVATLLSEGVKLPTVCTLLNIPIDEVWRFKHGMETGRTRMGAIALQTPHPEEATESSGVPSAVHPVWERLLDGSFELDIRVLSLKLLLARLREQMRLIADPTVRQMKVQEIHHYFVRYAPLLDAELAQMQRAMSAAAGRKS